MHLNHIPSRGTFILLKLLKQRSFMCCHGNRHRHQKYSKKRRRYSVSVIYCMKRSIWWLIVLGPEVASTAYFRPVSDNTAAASVFAVAFRDEVYHLTAVLETIILVPSRLCQVNCHCNLLGDRVPRVNLRVPDLQMRCSDWMKCLEWIYGYLIFKCVAVIEWNASSESTGTWSSNALQWLNEMPRVNLRVPDLQMRCSDWMNAFQHRSHCNGHQPVSYMTYWNRGPVSK